jgi:hypothetical protein
VKWLLVIFFTLPCMGLTAQEKQTTPVNEQQLENQAGRQEGVAEDDGQWQQLEYWQKHPLNLNEATGDELKALRLLTDLQIGNFLLYRKLLGALLHVNELQAIPAWDVPTIQSLLPFVTVNDARNMTVRLGERFRQGEQTFLLRLSRTISNSADHKKITEDYQGSPTAVLFRYKYNYRNLLQYGITGDKDAGEPFLKSAQKTGFDFYSFHLFARKLGIIQSLAIGDFTVAFGQGLIQWQGLAFKKSAEVLAIKRQGPMLQPYNSAGEYNFHRGVGVTLQKKKIQCTLFGSVRKLNANLVTDSAAGDTYISSIITTGYHRSTGELADRYNVQCITTGGAVRIANNRSHLGVQAVQYNLSKPLRPAAALYDRFAINDRNWSNYSFDYSYTFQNMHIYGEVAVDKLMNRAMIHGLLASLDTKVDMAVVYRNISSRYQSLFSNAFTESSLPVNENGLYAGVSIRPVAGWKLDVYADVFRFPWLRYQVNAPSAGHEYLVQISYTPNKYVELYTRFRHETKGNNSTDSGYAIPSPVPVTRLNWRTHISYRINKTVELRSRVETIWYSSSRERQKETGFLFYTDVHVKPAYRPFFFNARLQYFETGGYNSRIYAWENTVLYNYSIPAFFNKALRYLINVNYRLMPRPVRQHSKKFNCHIAASLAQTVYPFKTAIETTKAAVEAYNKCDIRLQIIFTRR